MSYALDLILSFSICFFASLFTEQAIDKKEYGRAAFFALFAALALLARISMASHVVVTVTP